MLPPSEYPIEDVAARRSDAAQHVRGHEDSADHEHPVLAAERRTYTSERGADSEEVHLRVIRDSNRRIMVLMTHNTDVADSWEREGEDPAFFYQFSPEGYALGIDVLLHAMTH